MAEITDIRLPEICFQVYEEIKSLPFYKAQKGYQFAAYLLNLYVYLLRPRRTFYTRIRKRNLSPGDVRNPWRKACGTYFNPD